MENDLKKNFKVNPAYSLSVFRTDQHSDPRVGLRFEGGTMEKARSIHLSANSFMDFLNLLDLTMNQFYELPPGQWKLLDTHQNFTVLVCVKESSFAPRTLEVSLNTFENNAYKRTSFYIPFRGYQAVRNFYSKKKEITNYLESQKNLRKLMRELVIDLGSVLAAYIVEVKASNLEHAALNALCRDMFLEHISRTTEFARLVMIACQRNSVKEKYDLENLAESLLSAVVDETNFRVAEMSNSRVKDDYSKPMTSEEEDEEVEDSETGDTEEFVVDDDDDDDDDDDTDDYDEDDVDGPAYSSLKEEDSGLLERKISE